MTGFSLLEYIKSFDMFGHVVQLNFNKGPSHNTFIGGFTSLIIKAIMFTFFFVRGRTIFTRSDDDYCTVEFLSDDDHLNFSFKETKLMLTPSIHKI